MVPVTETVTPDQQAPVQVTFRNAATGFAAQFAPWQAAAISTRFVANAGAGATVNIINAPGAGVSIFIHHLHHFTTQAASAAFGYFGDAGGGTFTEWAQIILGQPYDVPGHGVALPVNTAFVLKNESGVAMSNQTGSVIYSIG